MKYRCNPGHFQAGLLWMFVGDLVNVFRDKGIGVALDADSGRAFATTAGVLRQTLLLIVFICKQLRVFTAGLRKRKFGWRICGRGIFPARLASLQSPNASSGLCWCGCEADYIVGIIMSRNADFYKAALFLHGVFAQKTLVFGQGGCMLVFVH